MKTLDTFTKAYIEALLWSSTDMDGTPLDGFELAEEAIERAMEDCRLFQEENQTLLEQAYSFDDYGTNAAGHDFWLTRNGHGAGFWDHGLGEIGDQLTKQAHKFGQQDAVVGDNGLVYLEGGIKCPSS